MHGGTRCSFMTLVIGDSQTLLILQASDLIHKAAAGQSVLEAISAVDGEKDSPRPVLKVLAGAFKSLMKDHGMGWTIETSKSWPLHALAAHLLRNLSRLTV
jgi:hypothetical protein